MLADQIDAAGCPPCAGKSLRDVLHSLRDMRRPSWRSADDEAEDWDQSQNRDLHRCSYKELQFHIGINVSFRARVFGLGDVISLGDGSLPRKCGSHECIQKRKRMERSSDAYFQWQASPVLLESLAQIVDGSNIRKAGLKLGDFARPTASLGRQTEGQA